MMRVLAIFVILWFPTCRSANKPHEAELLTVDSDVYFSDEKSYDIEKKIIDNIAVQCMDDLGYMPSFKCKDLEPIDRGGEGIEATNEFEKFGIKAGTKLCRKPSLQGISNTDFSKRCDPNDRFGIKTNDKASWLYICRGQNEDTFNFDEINVVAVQHKKVLGGSHGSCYFAGRPGYKLKNEDAPYPQPGISPKSGHAWKMPSESDRIKETCTNCHGTPVVITPATKSLILENKLHYALATRKNKFHISSEILKSHGYHYKKLKNAGSGRYGCQSCHSLAGSNKFGCNYMIGAHMNFMANSSGSNDHYIGEKLGSLPYINPPEQGIIMPPPEYDQTVGIPDVSRVLEYCNDLQEIPVHPDYSDDSAVSETPPILKKVKEKYHP